MAVNRRDERFSTDDRERIAAAMAEFAIGADGRRWVNIQPDVDGRDDVSTGSWFGRALSSRGPVVPVLTWYPQHDRRHATEPTQVGIAHAAGKNAVPRLAQRGVRAPQAWVLVQDHQRQGILFAVPPGDWESETVRFAVEALDILSPFDVDGWCATFSSS